MENRPIEEYLGDGVYATFDGISLKLDLRGQDHTTVIHMDISVVEAFNKFQERIKQVMRT